MIIAGFKAQYEAVWSYYMQEVGKTVGFYVFLSYNMHMSPYVLAGLLI